MIIKYNLKVHVRFANFKYSGKNDKINKQKAIIFIICIIFYRKLPQSVKETNNNNSLHVFIIICFTDFREIVFSIYSQVYSFRTSVETSSKF